MDFSKLTDPQLYAQCTKYGSLARHYRQKFAGLLPEVYRRRLYKRRGFASIEEFAGKLAGMSHEATQKVLRLAKVLEDKPCLKEQLETGRVGWSKLHAVAYVATPDTDKDWATKVATMPKAALEAVVHNIRFEGTPGGNTQPEKHAITMYLSAAVEKKFRTIMHELSKQKKETIDFNTAMQELIAVYEARGTKNSSGSRTESTVQAPQATSLAARKEMVAQELPPEDKRYIPAKVRKLLKEEYGNFCVFPHCRKPSTAIHHTKRFALKPNHDPRYLAPLCHKHNTLAHSGLIANEEDHPKEWRLRPEPDRTSPKFRINQMMWRFAMHGV